MHTTELDGGGKLHYSPDCLGDIQLTRPDGTMVTLTVADDDGDAVLSAQTLGTLALRLFELHELRHGLKPSCRRCPHGPAHCGSTEGCMDYRHSEEVLTWLVNRTGEDWQRVRQTHADPGIEPTQRRLAVNGYARACETPMILMEPDRYDEAILGVVERFGQDPFVLYDRLKVLQILMRDDGMDYEGAEEFHDFNQAGLGADGVWGFLETRLDAMGDFMVAETLEPQPFSPQPVASGADRIVEDTPEEG
jgi:hypothetical protein